MTNCVLLVDDDDEFRESIGEILLDEGFDVLLAASAPQALEHASRHHPAICLLDVAMPGVDGVQLLRYFRSRHVFRQMPVILLTAGVRKDAVQQALVLGVKDIMLKSKFSVNELVDRIRRRMSGPVEVVRSPELFPSDSSHTLDSHGSSHESVPSSGAGIPYVAPSGFDSSLEFDLRDDRDSSPSGMTGQRSQRVVSSEMIQAVGGLRALPTIVESLVSVASRPEASLMDLHEIVRRDPVVAARIVQSANSAAFLRSSPVTHLEEALRVLGFANIVRIASSGGILRQEDLNGEAGSDLAALWRNSLATGFIAERLAPRQDKAAAFLQGLLHDLPSMFALQYLGSDWLAWRSHAMVKGWSLREALSTALGCPLEGLSGQILNAYRIPPNVAQPIQEFHEFFLALSPREPGRSARLLEISRMLATALGRPGTELSEVRTLHRDEVKALDLPDIFRQDVAEEISLLEQMARLPAPSDETLARSDRNIAMWRDPRWSAPDPVESVLARCFDCLRVERFEELASQRDRIRLAIAEPGTLEWERLGTLAPVIALHRGTLRPEPLPKGVDAIRMPLPIHLLVHRIERANP